MNSIVELKLKRLGDRMMSSHKTGFGYTKAVVDQIAQRCTEVETGARNIDHIINGTLLPRISTSILEHLSEDNMPERLDLDIEESGDFKLNFSSSAPGKGQENPAAASAELPAAQADLPEEAVAAPSA